MTDVIKKHTGGAPAPLRMMAAKGLAPLPPKDLAHVVYLLTGDAEPIIADAAQKTFAAFPERILQAVLADPKTASDVLDLFAENHADNARWMEIILLNRNTQDATFAKVAGRSANETVITMVANNQERLMRDLDIVRRLRGNTHCLKSTLDSVIDFLVRNGIVLDDVPEFAESMSRLGRTELEQAVAHIEVPFELLNPDLQEKAFREGTAPQWYRPGMEQEPPGADVEGMSLEELEQAALMEDDPDNAKKRETINQQLAKMNTSKKIALAMKGNKEVRTILIRETNKLVAEAVIKSPRITPQEIVAAANSRSVNDVVVRYIANSREMSRPYAVKLALINNPKSPIQISSRFLSLLRDNDLRGVAKSKSVPAAIQQMALKMVRAKTVKQK
jgi:hypothetical protein